MADDGDTVTIVGLCPGTAPVFGYEPATARIRKNLTLVGKVAGPFNGNTIPLLTPPTYLDQPILDAKSEAGVVVVENNAAVTLDRLTLTRGDKNTASGAGAGLYVAAGSNVTLQNSWVRSKAALLDRGIFVEGSAQINSSEISGNGGGSGGGLHTAGTTSISNSTLEDNQTAPAGGGAVFKQGIYRVGVSSVADNQGGGLINESGGNLVAYNSTLDLSTAGPGILNQGSLSLYNSIIFDNNYDGPAGGLVTSETATVVNSIIAGNFSFPNIQSDCASLDSRGRELRRSRRLALFVFSPRRAKGDEPGGRPPPLPSGRSGIRVRPPVATSVRQRDLCGDALHRIRIAT